MLTTNFTALCHHLGFMVISSMLIPDIFGFKSLLTLSTPFKKSINFSPVNMMISSPSVCFDLTHLLIYPDTAMLSTDMLLVFLPAGHFLVTLNALGRVEGTPSLDMITLVIFVLVELSAVEAMSPNVLGDTLVGIHVRSESRKPPGIG